MIHVESGPAEMKTMPGLVFLVEIMAMMESDEFCHDKLNDGGDCENLKHREMHVVMNLCWFEPNSLNIHRRLGSYAIFF